jgi:hypothetical protein
MRLLLLLSLAQGERNRELRSAFTTIYGCHAASVNANNRLNESKSKSVSPRCASFDSSLEEVPTNLRIETRAVVFHGKRSHVIVCSKRDTNQARSGQVFEFVVEQVGNDAVEESLVGQHFD